LAQKGVYGGDNTKKTARRIAKKYIALQVQVARGKKKRRDSLWKWVKNGGGRRRYHHKKSRIGERKRRGKKEKGKGATLSFEAVGVTKDCLRTRLNEKKVLARDSNRNLI